MAHSQSIAAGSGANVIQPSLTSRRSSPSAPRGPKSEENGLRRLRDEGMPVPRHSSGTKGTGLQTILHAYQKSHFGSGL
jgi:hypothetical protein